MVLNPKDVTAGLILSVTALIGVAAAPAAFANPIGPDSTVTDAYDPASPETSNGQAPEESVDVTPAADQEFAFDCTAGYWCVWDSTYGHGNRYRFHDSNPSWTAWAINNDDESSQNRLHHTHGAELYSETHYGGFLGCQNNGQVWHVHNPSNTGQSNKVVSHC